MPVLRRALTCAALSLAPGCFSDNKTTVTQPTSSSESSSETGTTDAPATTTDAPTTTTDTPTTTTSTTTAATTSTDDTTGPALCPGQPQCSPGDVKDTGALCDPCGRIHQTCQDDCTWSPGECVEDLSACVYWSIDTVDMVWERVALPQPPPEHAPTANILAAFDLQPDDRIVALTADRYHVLAGTDRTWTASGPLSDLLPALPGPLLHAFAVYNQDLQTYDVYAVSDPDAYIYTLPLGSLQATFNTTGSCCGSFNDLVHPPSPAAVRDVYVDLSPPFPWVSGVFYAECMDLNYDLGPHAGWATPTEMYVQELGYCFEMVYSQPLTQFAPFAVPGAPPGDRIGGLTMFGERLFVFAGE